MLTCARTNLKRLIWTFKIQQQERFNKIKGGSQLIKRDARRKIRSLLKNKESIQRLLMRFIICIRKIAGKNEA
jgi:hypothetical protein